MAVQEFVDAEEIHKAMNKVKQMDPNQMVGMGVITFLASAIEKLAEEIEELKRKDSQR